VLYVTVPLAGIVALAALFVIPPDPARTVGRRFDLPGAFSVTAGATLLVFGLVEGPELGWGDPVIVAALLLSVVLLAVFALVESRSADPLMPFRLFGNRSLTVGMTITFLFMGTFGVLPYFLTVLWQTTQGYSALKTGLAFLIPSLAIALGTQLGERLTTRIGTRRTLLIGLAGGVIGTVGLAFGFTPDTAYGVLVPGLIVSGVGQGIVWTAMWIASSTGTAAAEQGVASGIASTTLNLGNAIGLAVFTAIDDGGYLVVLLAAAVMIIGFLVSLLLRPVQPIAAE
jgi:predicted MFS family arabinose efflux permease